MQELARSYYTGSQCRTALDLDCRITPEMLSVSSVETLEALEPCGNGCPKPSFMLERLSVERMTMVGGGRHLRLRLRQGRYCVNAIYFSCGEEVNGLRIGDLVDVAFVPQINEYRAERSVQLSILDIRPSCVAACTMDSSAYHALRAGELGKEKAIALLPDRTTFAMIWRYLAALPGPVCENPMTLCRKIVRWSGLALDLGQLLVCLDIFSEVNLLRIQRQHKNIKIYLTTGSGKADLNRSSTMQCLLRLKES
jgi:single-stranded-DNA-specific exonuclease